MELTILLNTLLFQEAVQTDGISTEHRPHWQVQEAICDAPETCVMCQLWRAACGKGSPHLPCGLQAFPLIPHKWDAQWLAGTPPIHQIASKRHPLGAELSLESRPLESTACPSEGSRHHVEHVMSAGLWQLAPSALKGQTWHHLLLFWFNHGNWKPSGNSVATDIWLVGSFEFGNISTQRE